VPPEASTARPGEGLTTVVVLSSSRSVDKAVCIWLALRSPESSCVRKVLKSWEVYYHWRGLPASSIAALLMEFPLFLNFAITKIPQLMLKKKLLIHLVGAEKELNLIPLFGMSCGIFIIAK